MQPSSDFNLLEQMPGYLGWKDKEFRYLGCNKNLADMLQLKSVSKIVGTQDTDLLGCTEELFHFHSNNDQKALRGEIIKCIHKSSFPYDGAFFCFVKKPIVNVENNIVGILFQCNELIKASFFETLHQVDKKRCPKDLFPTHYQIGNLNTSIKLSIRELECLFCMLRGMTAKAISTKLNLSKRTIEAYIENIKNKFSCQNKSELIISAIQMGYMNMIPPRFVEHDFLHLLK